MSTFTEQRILKQVTTLQNQSAINVQWANQILKDGVVISETFERKAYTKEQDAEFLAEVEGAGPYMAALGWTIDTITATTTAMVAEAQGQVAERNAALAEAQAAAAASEQAKAAADAMKAEADQAAAAAVAAIAQARAAQEALAALNAAA